jgi:hypothetical protein
MDGGGPGPRTVGYFSRPETDPFPRGSLGSPSRPGGEGNRDDLGTHRRGGSGLAKTVRDRVVFLWPLAGLRKRGLWRDQRSDRPCGK